MDQLFTRVCKHLVQSVLVSHCNDAIRLTHFTWQTWYMGLSLCVSTAARQKLFGLVFSSLLCRSVRIFRGSCSLLSHPLRKHPTRLVILCASLTNFVLVTVSLPWFSFFRVAYSNFLSLVLKGLNPYKTILTHWTRTEQWFSLIWTDATTFGWIKVRLFGSEHCPGEFSRLSFWFGSNCNIRKFVPNHVGVKAPCRPITVVAVCITVTSSYICGREHVRLRRSFDAEVHVRLYSVLTLGTARLNSLKSIGLLTE